MLATVLTWMRCLRAMMKWAAARDSGSEKGRGPAYRSLQGSSEEPSSPQWKSQFRLRSTPLQGRPWKKRRAPTSWLERVFRHSRSTVCEYS